jgi:hypothetical protein
MADAPPLYDFATVGTLWVYGGGWLASALAALGQVCRWLADVEPWNSTLAGKHCALAVMLGTLAWTGVHTQDWPIWQKAALYIALGLIAPEAVRGLTEFVIAVLATRLADWRLRWSNPQPPPDNEEPR